MAEQQQRPGRFGRFLREGVDRLFLGNRGYNYQTGQWDRGGVVSGLTQQGLSTIGGPLAGGIYGLWANWDRRRGGDGVPFVDLGGNPEGLHSYSHRSYGTRWTPGGSMAGVYGARPTGIAGGGPVGVSPGGLAGYAARIGGGVVGGVPQGGQPPGGPMQIERVELQQEPDFRYTPQQIGSGPIRTINGPIMAPTNMGGARGMFNHGGSSITDPEAIARQMGMIPQAAWNPRAGYGDLQN